MLNFQDLAKITVEAVQENQEDSTNLTRRGGKNPKEIAKELRNEEVGAHVKDLLDTTSFHGISYIFDKKHPIRRVVWFLITVSAFIYSMLKVYESTVNHFSYPFNTARMRQYVSEIEFPAVSFCNTNDMRMSILNGTNVDLVIMKGNTAANVSGEEYRNVTGLAAHTIQEMLVDCEFNGQKCSHENFTRFYWKQGNQCFTFNSGQPGHPKLSVSGPGKRRSLSLTINVQHYDYYKGGLEAGIHLILHGQEETPVRMRGPMIPPGFTTYVQIEKKKIINLKPPYKTRCGSIKLTYFSGYSKHTCWLEQLTKYVTRECQCKDFFMPGEFPTCSIEKSFSCMWPAWETFEQGKLFDCPLPCEIDSYKSKSISKALFPTRQQAKLLQHRLKDLPHMEKIDLSDPTRFMRDNLLRVVIFYDNMSYERLEQVPSYDTLVWLGDVGGQIGLFIGAGAMSYFELLDCLALVMYARFFQSFGGDEEEKDEEEIEEVPV